jgi:hypothetical protein
MQLMLPRCCRLFFSVWSVGAFAQIKLYLIYLAYNYIYISGWCFGTFFMFPYIGKNHPNWLIFFRGVETTNQLCIMLIFWPINHIVSNAEFGFIIVMTMRPCVISRLRCPIFVDIISPHLTAWWPAILEAQKEVTPLNSFCYWATINETK